MDGWFEGSGVGEWMGVLGLDVENVKNGTP